MIEIPLAGFATGRGGKRSLEADRARNAKGRGDRAEKE